MKQSIVFRRITLTALMAVLAVTMMIPASASLFSPPEAAAPAAVATFSKNGTVGEAFTFSASDFVPEHTDQALDSLILTALPDPSAGVLTMGSTELAVGDVVGMGAVAGLRFRPLDAPTVATTGFTFTPVFADGTAGGDCSVGLYLLTAENGAPIARNLELSTYKNVAVTEQFSATDPEGDLITYRLVNKPARGAVTMPQEGLTEFTYTPYENKTGKDTFTYVAIDAVGNSSAPATVRIQIEKPNTKVSYADMEGVSAYKSAIRLAEQGILIGENMGGTYFFQPEQAMSRDQFVALAMNTIGIDALEGVTRTGFSDDAAIPTWAKPYVSSALKSGLVQGAMSDGGVVFNATSTITKAEAAVLLNRMLQISDAAVTTMFTDSEYAPAWAYQAAVNLETVGVLKTNSDGALGLSDGLTRADAAELLDRALDVLEARQSDSWFQW